MGSKAIVLLCFFLAVFLMIASEVTARELAETSTSVETLKGDAGEVSVEGHRNPAQGYEGGSGYGRGGGYGGGSGGGYGGGGGHHGGGCHCCGHHYCRCCSNAGEAMDAEPEAKP